MSGAKDTNKKIDNRVFNKISSVHKKASYGINFFFIELIF